MSNNSFNWLIEIILGLFSLIIVTFLLIFSKPTDYYVLFTIIIAIFTISVTWYLHKTKQLSLLEACLNQVELIESDSDGFKDTINKGCLPLYYMKEIGALEFSVSLDAKIIGYRTAIIKKLFFNINDKIKLINGYLNNILEDYLNFLKEKNYKNQEEAWEEFKKRNQIYSYFQPRINSHIPELDKFICKLKCILTERFGIK